MHFIRTAAPIILGLMLYSKAAYAYIDPGVTYAVLQGLFALVFGAGVAWIMRPWRYVTRLFRQSDPASQDGVPEEGSREKEPPE